MGREHAEHIKKEIEERNEYELAELHRLSNGTVFTVGKHRGRTFLDVKDNEPAYCSWVLQLAEPSDTLKAFVEYLHAEGVTLQSIHRAAALAASSPPSAASQGGTPSLAGTIFTTGKHMGRSFEDVKINEPAFVVWAVELDDCTKTMQLFKEYLAAEGI